MALMESPPSMKKSSWTPMSCRPNTSRQTCKTIFSNGFTELSNDSILLFESGLGNVFLSTLPLTFRGRASRLIKNAGIAYDGNLSARERLTA